MRAVVLEELRPSDAAGRVHAGPGECSHRLGGLPCVNGAAHPGGGRGCVHHSTSGVPDRHDQRARSAGH